MGLLAFVLAGIALFLSKSDTIQMSARALAEVATGPKLSFEVQTNTQNTPVKSSSAVVQRSGLTSPLILSGLPAYASAAFYMPLDARPTSGYLQINVTVQALSGVEGVLRATINNEKRAELLLRPGEAGRSMRIELYEAELAREQLVVSFSLQGEGPHTPCGIDTGIEAVVEIETTSALFLQLDRPIETSRDRILVSGKMAKILWDETQNDAALMTGAQLHRAGVNVSYGPQGIAPDLALAALSSFQDMGTRQPHAWTKSMAPSASLYSARRFYRTNAWRIRYDMLSAASQTLPDIFELDMKLGELPMGAHWHVHVFLNGKLIDDTRTASGILSRSIALPIQAQSRHNVIDIQATSDFDPPGQCNRGMELVADILETSNLQSGTVDFAAPITDVLEYLNAGWSLGAAQITKAEAHAVTLLLAEFPISHQIADAKVRVDAVSRGTLLSDYRATPSDKWFIYFDDAQMMQVMALRDYPFSITRETGLIVDARGSAT